MGTQPTKTQTSAAAFLKIMAQARLLASEPDARNPEYDRALVELTTATAPLDELNLSHDQVRDLVEDVVYS